MIALRNADILFSCRQFGYGFRIIIGIPIPRDARHIEHSTADTECNRVESVSFALDVYGESAGFSIDMSAVSTLVYVIVTFSLLLGSSMSEIIRTAYLSVPKGQYEAAVMVGLTPVTAIRRIIFPQGFIVALPNLGNIFIFMLKEGALAYTIGLHDVLGRGMYLSGLKANIYNFELYLALTLIYWPLTFILEKLFKAWEKALRNKKLKRRES